MNEYELSQLKDFSLDTVKLGRFLAHKRGQKSLRQAASEMGLDNHMKLHRLELGLYAQSAETLAKVLVWADVSAQELVEHFDKDRKQSPSEFSEDYA